MLLILKLALILLFYPQNAYFYAAYRLTNNNCGYYDNPAFTFNSPIEVESRFNYIPKDYKQEKVNNQEGYKLGYYITPADDLIQSEEEVDERSDEAVLQANQFWKIGEIPPNVKGEFVTLPDVFVGAELGESHHPFVADDAPPISDVMSMEKSELTVETHDMGDFEIGETDLHNLEAKPEEIFLETITQPELPNFKQFDNNNSKLSINNKMEKEKALFHKEQLKEKNKDSVIMKIKKQKIAEKEMPKELVIEEVPEKTNEEQIPKKLIEEDVTMKKKEEKEEIKRVEEIKEIKEEKEINIGKNEEIVEKTEELTTDQPSSEKKVVSSD